MGDNRLHGGTLESHRYRSAEHGGYRTSRCATANRMLPVPIIHTLAGLVCYDWRSRASQLKLAGGPDMYARHPKCKGTGDIQLPAVHLLFPVSLLLTESSSRQYHDLVVAEVPFCCH